MAFLLNIETSTKNCSVAFSYKGKLLSVCEERKDNFSHAENQHNFIKWALEASDRPLSSLDGVCVSSGPGSYTGLRIGLAAAKGICFGQNIPLISALSLDALALGPQKEEYDVIIPMVDARRMEVYTVNYSGDGNRLSEPHALIVEEHSFRKFENKRTLFIGDGALKCKKLLNKPNWNFVEAYPSAKQLIDLSYKKYLLNDFEPLDSFNPNYLKEFVAGQPKKLI